TAKRRAKAPAPRKATASRVPQAKPVAAESARPVRPTLERERRRLTDEERLGTPKTLVDDRLISSARSGHDELRAALAKHTEASACLRGGDVDGKWEDAYAVGDEAPGGDNPTPGQDRVDDIGKALGVQYQDDQELKGGDEISERDRHRWELDPASS